MSDQPSQEPRHAVVVDDRMLDLVDVREVAQWLGGDAAWSEGPVYLPAEDAVTGEVSTHRSDVEFTNGRTLDLEGFNSPNDVVVKAVFAPDGVRLGSVPQVVGNLCFGGPDRSTVFVAATSSLHRIRTRTRGCSPTDLAGATR